MGKLRNSDFILLPDLKGYSFRALAVQPNEFLLSSIEIKGTTCSHVSSCRIAALLKLYTFPGKIR